VIFKPGLQAVRMKDVTAWQEHGVFTHREVVLAHGAYRSFVLLTPILFLAVALLNGHYRDLLDYLLLGRLLLLFGLLTGNFHYSS